MLGIRDALNGLGSGSPQGSRPIMQSRPNNIIPLNGKPSHHSLLEDVCEQLNQLTQEHIHPVVNALVPYLIDQIDAELERTTNNHEIMMKMEMKNALLKHSSQISSQFKELSSISELTSTDHEEPENLILLDNMELEQKLVWVIVAEKMSDKDNVQHIFHIKNRFEHAFPEFNGQIPATPEKLCESFSTAIDSILPPESFKQQLLYWFIKFIKECSDSLWREADQLLEDIGLGLKVSIKAPEKHNHSATLPGSKQYNSLTDNVENSKTSQPAFSGFGDFEASFMDSLAERLVTHVEDMLIRDDLIPESKKNQVRTLDLAGVLARLQMEVMQQHESITNLNESIQSALNERGENSKLSPRHEDLIYLVGMLFEYILDDHMLPENIRKSISLLQIPVLRTVILDHDFLTNKHHPARILLNELTSAGMECKDNCLTDPVYRLIDSIVRIIISKSYENPDIFKDCLEKFRTELAAINCLPDEIPEEQEPERSLETRTLEPEKNDQEEGSVEELLPQETPFNEDEAEEIVLESSALEQTANSLDPVTPVENIEADSTQSVQHKTSTPQELFQPVKGLKIGQWVEFVGEGKQHRLNCKLAHIDKHTNRYIFENRSGMKVAECDGRHLLNGIENGSIIIQNDVQIFDKALQAVFYKFKKH